MGEVGSCVSKVSSDGTEVKGSSPYTFTPGEDSFTDRVG